LQTKRYHFIVNPKSGSCVSIGDVRRLRDYLRSGGNFVRLDLTRSLRHAGQLAAQARDGAADAIVVIGGDGTVRSVADAMAGTDLPILIVPAGTENLLARELGLDSSFSTALRCLDHGQVRKLDLGSANGRHFMAILGVGFDAQVVERMNRLRRGHITHTDYIWPICRTFWEYRFPHMRVEADGKLLCDEPALVFVGNISRYAIGLDIMPHADFGDGLLDLCIYKCRRHGELLWHSVRTVLGLSRLKWRVVTCKCREITISSPDSHVPVQLDGDPGPKLPLEVRVVPAAAQIIAPPPPGHASYSPPVSHVHLRQWLLR